MAPPSPASGLRASGALLAVAAGVAVTVLMTWVRADGSQIPESMDIGQADFDRAGTAETLRVAGAQTWLGAVLLAFACVLVTVALWAVSPGYRPSWAGYSTIVISLIGAAGSLWFIVGATLRVDAFGSSVDVQVDTVDTTVWPWLCLGFWAFAAIIGILLVPPRGSAD